MSGSDDTRGSAKQFVSLLDSAAQASKTVTFWWRDDDAVTATDELDRLLALRERHGVPLALAVIPAPATIALAKRLARERQVSVLQHGWSHANHAPESAKKTELGGGRSTSEVVDELRRGFQRLSTLFPERFLPVLVPPWNRIATEVAEARREVGLVGLSTFGAAPKSDPHWVNVHLDIFAGHPRRPLACEDAFRILAAEMDRRLAGDAEPIGIMTHHLVHEAESWSLLESLFATIARHPGARWPDVAEMFAVG